MAKSRKKIRQSREMRAADEETRSWNEHVYNSNEAYTKGAFMYLRLTVHILAAMQFVYGIYYHNFKVHWPENLLNEEELKAQWGGKFKYLTFLNVILQAFYHVLALVNDLFGSNSISLREDTSKLRRCRDYIFSTWAFPVAHNVAITFWIIYAYDRELIFPRALDAIFPNWLNHVVHTNVAMLAIMDLFTCFRQYPSRLAGVTGNVSFMIFYIIWLHIVRYYSGVWVYPLLEVLNLPLRYLMLSALLAFNLFLYFLGEALNGIIWAWDLELLQRIKAKQS